MAMDLNQLRDLLARISRIVDSSGGKRQAGDLRALADVLAEERAPSVEEAINQIRVRLAHPPRKRPQPKRPTLSVDEYVHKLEDAKDEADIYKLLQEFRDKAFKKAELDKIAHRFAKGPARYKSKGEAIVDIEGRFFQRKRTANEIKFLERKKVTPW